MKKYFILAATALALASCVNDDYVGDNPEGGTAGEAAITFDGGSGVTTRAAATGATAATALNNNFVVFGYKTLNDASSTKQTVYDHYTVKYTDGSANSTKSNTAGWEYVGQTFNMLTSLTTDGNSQEIKYWDQAAKQYDFVAFSTGTATQVKTDAEVADGKVLVSAINNTPTYTIKGAVADLAKCYISDRVTATKDATVKANLLYKYKDAIQFGFRSLGSKVRIGLYEKIPGYSVKDVKFYNATGLIADANQAPTLYNSGTATIPGGTGTVTVTFPETGNTKTDYNRAHAAFTGGTNTKEATLTAMTLKAAEKKEATGDVYLGRESNTAAMTAYSTFLPTAAGELTLKVDYTLLSTDGTGETIEVKGATATVPSQYTNWQANYAYTYLFKISDNTNGEIGGEAGLYPITFDAVTMDDADGVQETITTVATPSITTYEKGAIVTANNEYTAGDIYVTVSGNPTLTEGNNYNLYTATIEDGAAQGITEESVANCLKNYTGVTAADADASGSVLATETALDGKFTKGADGVYYKCAAGSKADGTSTYYTIDTTKYTGYVVKDANGKKLTVTLANDKAEPLTAIPATATPDGNELTLNCAKITASASTVYVFEYINTNKYYKVIKVQ